MTNDKETKIHQPLNEALPNPATRQLVLDALDELVENHNIGLRIEALAKAESDKHKANKEKRG